MLAEPFRLTFLSRERAWTVVDIESEQPADAGGIETVLLDAFADADEAELTVALREGGHLRDGCSMVARDGGIVGYAGIADVELDSNPSLDLAVLGPVAVTETRQGAGIGTTVVREALRACTRTGCLAVITEGDPDYYGRFGFEPAVEYGIDSDLDPPSWAFQVAPIQPTGLAGVSGTIRHPAPFHDL